MKKPQLPQIFEEIPVDIASEDVIEYCKIEDTTIPRPQYKQSYSCCLFDNVTWEKNEVTLEFTDCVFKNCDLSNLDLTDTSIYRCEFINCRMLGVNFASSTLKYVRFENCLLNYSNFSFSKLNEVEINECVMKSSIFDQTELKKSEITNTNLEESEFVQTKLKDMDFTSNILLGIRVTVDSLPGLIIDEYQALDFVKLLGVIIK